MAGLPPRRPGNGPTPGAPATPAPDPVAEEIDYLKNVVRGGSNAYEAISAILGADKLTGDVEADCIAAMRASDEWQRLWPWRRGLLLHSLHGRATPEAENNPNRALRDPWVLVALKVGRAFQTVRKWSHPPGWEDDQD